MNNSVPQKKWSQLIILSVIIFSIFIFSFWKVTVDTKITFTNIAILLIVFIAFIYIISAIILPFTIKLDFDGVKQFSIFKGWQYLKWESINKSTQILPTEVNLYSNEKRIQISLHCFKDSAEAYEFIIAQLKKNGFTLESK
jgi:hypothetical protein